MHLIVIAKAPVAGRSKTRLCPPCTADEAAHLAEASLLDTFDAVHEAARRLHAQPVLALDGGPGPWIPDGMRVILQRGIGLDERLAAAFDDVGGPAFLIGMDTPQITPALLVEAVGRLRAPGVDAVLGEATDGGWWAIGLRRPDARAFLGVPMSRHDTHVEQRARLEELELVTSELPVLRDVDRFADAIAVASAAPGTRFAAAVASLAIAEVEHR